MNIISNEISLRYRQALVIEPGTGESSPRAILGLLTELAKVGYTLDKPVMDMLKTYNETELAMFHGFILKTINGMIGNNVKHRPLFKNFPKDIPDDDVHLLNRIVGYLASELNIVPEETGTPLSCGHVIDSRLFNLDEFGACPICQHQVDELGFDASDRPALADITRAKVITMGNGATVLNIFRNLISAKSSISEEDKSTIETLIKNNSAIVPFIPEDIPFKENMATTVGAVLNNVDNENEATDGIAAFVKTPTDILRVAIHLSGGDVSLSNKQDRIKLSNPHRRLIMSLLDKVKNPQEDMMMHRMRWIRMGEVLHIGQKAKKYPNAFKAFDQLRNSPEDIATFNRSVEAMVHLINTNSVHLDLTEIDLIKLLSTRPGMFARRLDWMLRTFSDPQRVVATFIGLIDNLPTIMLMTLSVHLNTRKTKNKDDKRYFIPKGSLSKLQVVNDDRNAINEEFAEKIGTEIGDELELRFSKLESLGRVYINKDLFYVPIPTGQRSASKSLVTLPRGAQVPIPENKAFRMFLYWKENEETDVVDVDLSAVAYDEDWNMKYHLSYTSLSAVGGVHSGDILSAPNGASEFIDINIETALSQDIRYITLNVLSYTRQNFNTFECFAGIMGRDEVNSGEIYEPTTVVNKFDLAGATGQNLPLVFDIKKRVLIWADMALSSQMFNNVENSAQSIVEVAKMIENLPHTKPTLGQLFVLHGGARGTQVDFEREEGVEYDTEFDMDRATQIDDILANWL